MARRIHDEALFVQTLAENSNILSAIQSVLWNASTEVW